MQLDMYAKRLFCGVFAMDRLPKRRNKQQGAYIINTDNHDEPGSHWVAVYVDSSGQVEYMDSYGLPPLHKQSLQFLGKCYRYNTRTLQRLYSNACGFYCVYYILKRARGETAESILALLSRVDSDFVVKNYVYQRYSPIFK